MPPDIALITAAGWKGGFIEAKLPRKSMPVRCPEILYPLHRGTILSRLTEQLRQLGVQKVVVGLANPESLSTAWVEAHWFESRGHRCPGRLGTPYMTQQRVTEAVESCDDYVLVDDALRMSQWETMKALLEHVSDWGWETAAVLPGDFVFQTGFLNRIFSLAEYPSYCWMMKRHEIIFLTPEMAQRWLEYYHRRLQEVGARWAGVNAPKRRLRSNRMLLDAAILEEMGLVHWSLEDRLGRHWTSFIPEECVELGIGANEYEEAVSLSRRDPV